MEEDINLEDRIEVVGIELEETNLVEGIILKDIVKEEKVKVDKLVMVIDKVESMVFNI